MDIREKLSLKRSKYVLSESREFKDFNIGTFRRLDKTGLEFEKIERRILLNEDENNRLYIQYPGKETVRDVNSQNPYDMRPVAVINNEKTKDLSFKDIWNDLTKIHSSNKDTLPILASIFFRIAYMISYRKEKNTYKYEDFDFESGNILNTGEVELELYRPSFDDDIFEFLDNNVGEYFGMPAKYYIHYNDLLAQNEDCKYSYRAEAKGDKWDGKVGRTNTMLTHITIIQYLLGQISFIEIMDKFQRGRGVAAISLKHIDSVTDNIIVSE